jgi:serpin B
MMRQSSSFPYGAGEGWQAVELPYLHDELSMLIVVPDQGRFAEVETRLASGLIGEAAAGLMRGAEVNLTMPKFEFRTQTDLNDSLRALGMETAFDPRNADFSRMVDYGSSPTAANEKLYISDVIHEAYIAVDEEGTEAVAATAVVMRTASAPLEIVDLRIDRPCIFALRDVETGALLFLGRVTDPTA